MIRGRVIRAGAFVRAVLREAIDDGVDDLAAMMTYYAVLAVFPMVIFVLAITLLVLPPDALSGAISSLRAVVPSQIADAAAVQLTRAHATTSPHVAIIGGLAALWGASRGTSALIIALDRVFDAEESRSWLHRQGIAIAATLGVAMVLAAALTLVLAGPIVAAFARYAPWLSSFDSTLWTLARWSGAAMLLVGLWATAFHVLPDDRVSPRAAVIGAVVGVSLWLVATRLGMVAYGMVANLDATYGALAGVVTFLLWLWLSNMALLIGAEVAQHASRRAAVVRDAMRGARGVRSVCADPETAASSGP
ncbi:MAG: YihY/virulence factor BrkB family protein [Deltaproteobacteria bacterium]|nr:YihY/virulence factor BrkB family protein [Deltaproteobacteria bacterium]